MAVIGLVANGPAQTTATIAKEADAKFSKSQPVNERLFNQKVDYDKILSQTKFKLPIDTVIDAGDWDLSITLDSNGRMLKSSISRDFSFGNHTEVLTTSTWGPNSVPWLGSESDTTSIKMDAKMVEEEGKLSMVLTAKDWESKIRTIILRDGEQPEFIFNNGVKDTTDKGCVVQFSNVQKNGDNISLTAGLVSLLAGMAAELTYPPNFSLRGLIEAGPGAQVQNWLDLLVKDTLTARIAAWDSQHNKFTYSTQKFKNVLKVDITNNYKYAKTDHEFWTRYIYRNGEYDGEMSGALYELGMRNGRLPASYARFTKEGSPLNTDTTSYLLGDIATTTPTTIAIGGAPSSNVDVLGSLTSQSERLRWLVIRTGNNVWNLDGGSAVLLYLQRPMNDSAAPWTLNNGLLDSGSVSKNSGGYYEVVPKRQATEFVIDYNLRVRVIDNRHIVIEDITPESMKGDKFYTPNTVVTPYERSQDTTDVIDPIARSSVLKVYPNPASDQLTVEVTGQSQTWVNLTDLYGRVVKNVYNGPVEGSSSFPLSTSDLPSGVYFLQVRGTSKSEAIKVEIIH